MRLTTLLLGAVLFASSCGGSSDPNELTTSGERALASQDFATAEADFASALAAIGDNASDPLYMRAKLGSIEARAGDDPAAVVTELIELAAGGKVSDRDFNRIAGRLGDSKHFADATKLLAEAKKLFPDASHLDTLGAKLAADATKAGDSDAIDALAGLGYVGE